MDRLSINDPLWREFVERQHDAHPFHHPAWSSLLAETYGYPAFVLTVSGRDGRPIAGLPFIAARGRWISLPYTDVLEPLAVDSGAREKLLDGLAGMRSERGVKAIEVRSDVRRDGFAGRPAGVIHTLELRPDPAATMRSFRRSHVKRNIASAKRQGVTVREASTADDLAGHFYKLHLGTRRRQGSPIQPRRFFRLFWQRIVEPGFGFCLLAELRGEPIAGAVFLAWNTTLTYKYGASDERHLQARPNHLVLWRAIERATERGLRWLDLGRSEVEQGGLREFKSSWGALERPLVYSSVGESPSAGRSEPLLDAMGVVIRHSPPIVCRALGEAFYRYAV